MKEFEAYFVFDMGDLLGRLEYIRTLLDTQTDNPFGTPPQEAIDQATQLLGSDSFFNERNESRFIDWEFPVSYQAFCEVSEYLRDIKQIGIQTGELSLRIDHFKRTIKNELRSKLFLTIPSNRYPYLLRDYTAIEAKIQGVQSELEESASCYVFRRHTASVFHALRTMELSLKALAAAIPIIPFVTKEYPTWGNWLDKVAQGIESQKKSGSITPQREQFYRDAHALLQVVRTVWRNASMHVDRKYTEDEARRIFDAVFAFTEHLASGL